MFLSKLKNIMEAKDKSTLLKELERELDREIERLKKLKEGRKDGIEPAKEKSDRGFKEKERKKERINRIKVNGMEIEVPEGYEVIINAEGNVKLVPKNKEKGGFWEETFKEFGFRMKPKEFMALQKKWYKRILFLFLLGWGILILGHVMVGIWADDVFTPMFEPTENDPIGYVIMIVLALFAFSILFIILKFSHEIFKRIES